MPGVEEQGWWPEFLELKDDLGLRELAEQFGTTPGALSSALRRTGIRRLPDSGKDPLGPRSGSKDHLLEPFRDLLGRVPDAEVAERAQVSTRTVASYRARHEIPGYRRGARRKLDAVRALLGRVPDVDVAQELGLTVDEVRWYRDQAGIEVASGAWQVRYAGRAPVVVLASAIDQALASAQALGVVDRIVGIEWVGDLSGSPVPR